MKKKFLIMMMFLLISFPLSAQVTQDSLTLDWGATVNYGSFGQRTVLVNDTLWHFGGRFYYGTPFGANRWDQSFVEYRALTDTYWTVDATTTLYRFYGNAHSYDGKVYLLGGGGGDPLAVEVFDPATRTVSLLEPMPAHHRNAGSALYEGKIYMIAGSDDGAYSNRVDIYDIANNSWSTGADHPLAAQTEATLHGNMIYTMGGFDGSTRNEIYTYDIANDTWTAMGTMPYPTSANRMVTHNDFLYIIGDYADLNRLMRYSINDASWVEYESNLIGRRHSSAVIADDKLYIIAGNSNENGSWQYYNLSQTIDLSSLVSISPQGLKIPTVSRLSQNYPNPFNPSTSIRFILHQKSSVEMSIYNLKGELIRQLSNQVFGPGKQELIWDGKDARGVRQASGQYLYTMKTDSGIESRKMIMLR
ncbi:MAG: T9SS type A sorting domain-containing protein [FCB group bacterium]|nr:T9SS type A sorting domain-containing protein [FCB group bacterium]MBL7027343.1 T9SS type A sorting domain-containing protein [Candidatus Neomarinimicrobiota bacterium]MBL7122706.1 T9SS type A sorting domain-containing protein [Candidatus Neomarinimicrobiota bacterium]